MTICYLRRVGQSHRFFEPRFLAMVGAVRSWVTLFCLGTAGCLAALVVPLPELGADAETLIVHVRSEGGEQIWVTDAKTPEPLPPTVLHRGAGIRAYTLNYSPQALQMARGLQTSASGARLLAPSTQSWRGDLTDDGVQWQSVAPDPTLDTFPLPAFDWALCLEQTGCAPRTRTPTTHCDYDCPGAEPALPASPLAPQGTSFVAQGQDETLTYRAALPSAAACSAGQKQAYGSSECAPVGRCPQGWPAPSATGTTWYVELGGSGTGTREAPFASLSSALAQAQPADTILVGEGTYPAPQILQGPLKVRGRCPAQTILSSAVPVQVSGTGVQISDLRLPELAVTDGDLRLERVLWLDAPVALTQYSGRISIVDALAQRTTGTAFVSNEGRLSLQRVVIDRTSNGGIKCETHAQCILKQVAVRHFGDPQATENLDPDPAILISGASFAIEEFIIESGFADGLIVQNTATGTAAIGLLHNIGGPGTLGRGIRVREDAHLYVHDLFILRVNSSALNVSTQGTLEARDIVVLNTQGGGTFGLQPRGASMRVERAYVHENIRPLLESNRDGRCTVELIDIRYTSAASGPRTPYALLNLTDGQATLQRVHLTSKGPVVIDTVATVPGTTLTLVDVRTEGGTQALRVDTQVEVNATRVYFTGASNAGILVPKINANELGSDFTGEDVTIEIAGDPSGQVYQGTALEVGQHGRATIERFALIGPALHGIQLRKFGSLDLSDGKIVGPELGLRVHVRARSTVEDALRNVRVEAPRLLEVARD